VIKQHITKPTIIAYALGVATAGTGLQVLSVVAPSDAVDALHDQMCGSAIAAQIEYSTAQIMECVQNRAACEGKLEILERK
jgi:hypothetical protein